jgi:hypothetical protein
MTTDTIDRTFGMNMWGTVPVIIERCPTSYEMLFLVACKTKICFDDCG